MERDQLPNKIERLDLITPWVDTVVAEAAKLPKNDSIYPPEVALLDMVPAREEDAEDMGFLGMVAFKRAAYLRLPLTTAALLSIVYMSDRPGSVVLYLTVLKHLHAAAELPGVPSVVTFKQVTEVFPSPPPPSFVEKHWDLQKWHGVSLVDLMGPGDFLLTPEEAAAEAAKEPSEGNAA